MRCSGVEDKRKEVVENVKREVFRQEFEIKEMEEERRREEGTI